MANITFYLKSENPDKKGLVSILIQITHNYKRVRLSSGEKVKPTHWNKKKQRTIENKDTNSNLEYIRINKFLDEIESKFKNLVSNAKLKDIELTDAYLKNNLFKEEVKGRKAFFDAYEEYIEMSKSVKTAGTISSYKTAKAWFLKFEKDTNYQMNFSEIDLPFFDKLKDSAFVKNSYSDNTFQKNVKILKSMLVWSEERGYYDKKVHKKFKHTYREREVIYLTMDELMSLYNHKFENLKHQSAVDLFCFGCFTGLRVSDIYQLSRENIQNGEIHKTIQKTQQQEVIPLNVFALNILKKYENLPDYPLPRVLATMHNKYLRACCKDVGIETPVTITKFSGSKKIETTLPKWEFITTHTARKTFVTNSLMLGMNVKTIKSITGHKLDSSFERYLKITDTYKKSAMDNTWNKIEVKPLDEMQ